MPYKSPLARLPATTPKNIKSPKLVPPAVLRLPDGRVIETQEIMHKQTNKISYDLRAGIQYGYRFKRKIATDTQDLCCKKATDQ